MTNVSDNNYIYFWVGKNIRKYRKLKGWTQKELAQRCNLTEKYIQAIESSTQVKTYSLNTFYHISKILEIHPRQLLDDER